MTASEGLGGEAWRVRSVLRVFLVVKGSGAHHAEESSRVKEWLVVVDWSLGWGTRSQTRRW
jgi:hypothetical protein